MANKQRSLEEAPRGFLQGVQSAVFSTQRGAVSALTGFSGFFLHEIETVFRQANWMSTAEQRCCLSQATDQRVAGGCDGAPAPVESEGQLRLWLGHMKGEQVDQASDAGSRGVTESRLQLSRMTLMHFLLKFSRMCIVIRVTPRMRVRRHLRTVPAQSSRLLEI